MNGEGSLGGITNEFQQNRKRMHALYNDMQEKLYKELDIAKLIKEKGNDAIDIIGRCISSRTVYDIHHTWTEPLLKDNQRMMMKRHYMMFIKIWKLKLMWILR